MNNLDKDTTFSRKSYKYIRELKGSEVRLFLNVQASISQENIGLGKYSFVEAIGIIRRVITENHIPKELINIGIIYKQTCLQFYHPDLDGNLQIYYSNENTYFHDKLKFKEVLDILDSLINSDNSNPVDSGFVV